MARAAFLLTASVVVLAMLAVAALWVFQRQLVYLPGQDPVPPAGAVLSGALDVVLKTEDGLELGSWYIPAAAPVAPAVLVASGNGGSRELRAPLARALAERGLSVLLFDYRGYGGNRGSPASRAWPSTSVRLAASSWRTPGCRRPDCCTSARAWALPS